MLPNVELVMMELESHVEFGVGEDGDGVVIAGWSWSWSFMVMNYVDGVVKAGWSWSWSFIVTNLEIFCTKYTYNFIDMINFYCINMYSKISMRCRKINVLTTLRDSSSKKH